MDIYYLKEHMFEEIHDARDYLKQAMKCKEKGSEWGKTFYDMAAAELEHSRNFYKMFSEHYKKINTNPDLEEYMEPFKDMAIAAYLKDAGEVRYMQDLYNAK